MKNMRRSVSKISKMTLVFVSMILVSQFIISSVIAADVSVSRSMPSRVDPQGVLTVSFSITPSGTVSGFDLAELIPQTWEIADWSVSGFNKNDIDMDVKDSQEFMGATYKGYHWKFNEDLTSSLTLTYTINVPVSSGNYNFVGIWTYPGGFDKNEKTLSVAVAPTTTTTTTTVGIPIGETGVWQILVIVALVVIALVILLYKKGLVF